MELTRPDGNVTTVWRLDHSRYADDPDYRQRIDQWANQQIPGAAGGDLEVITDDAGQHILTGTTRWNTEADTFHRDTAGRVTSRLELAPIDPKDIPR